MEIADTVLESAAFPLEKKETILINDVETEIVCSVFANQNFVLITQINKVGSLLKAWSEPKSDGGLRYFVENVLGRRDDPLLNIFARQLIERCSFFTSKPLLLAISLKEEGRGKEHFEATVNLAIELLVSLYGKKEESSGEELREANWR
eukprot:scaffold5444_cov181-Ochromonas_danica.AAC.7